jgi:LacI family transcriptional regulator
VDVDNARGARLAAEHLAALGHTRIAHLMGDAVQASTGERLRSLGDALDRLGILLRPDWCLPCSYNGRLGYESTCRLLALPDPPTAILAGNDSLALAAMQAARDMGVRVPEQLSVVGFDDIPTASMATPPLTTVRQPLAEIGERATRLLVARIEGDTVVPRIHRADPALVIRGSTAPPAPAPPDAIVGAGTQAELPVWEPHLARKEELK